MDKIAESYSLVLQKIFGRYLTQNQKVERFMND